MRVLYSVYALGAFAFISSAATVPSGIESNSTFYRRAGSPDDVSVEDVPQEGGECNGHSFSFNHIVAQIQHAVTKWPDMRVGPDGARNPYPHPYTDTKGPAVVPMSPECQTAKSQANMYEFPISGDDNLYEGGPIKGTITERVMFRVDQDDYRQAGWNGNSIVHYCAMGSHSAPATGNQIRDCGLYAGQ